MNGLEKKYKRTVFGEKEKNGESRNNYEKENIKYTVVRKYDCCFMHQH